jgi:signal transduction histidine kinase
MPWPFDPAAPAPALARSVRPMELQMRSHPWESTGIGPVAQWPLGLKLALRALLDSSLPMVLAWGPDCTQFFNDACLPLVKDRHPQPLGADARATWRDLVPDIDRIVARVTRGEPAEGKGLVLDIDRAGYTETCRFNDIYSPVYGDSGVPQGMLATFVDTAQEREQILTSERAARAEAERHNKMKDEFLAMLAHELRNPLAPITSAAQLLRLPEVSEGLRLKASNIISRQVRHMTELVDDLLDVSRVTRGLVKLENAILDLNKVAIAAVEQARPHIEERGHTLRVDLPPQPVPVEGDRTRLIQVLVNLLNNSAKYTPPGGRIGLTVTVAQDAGGGAAAAAVRDNGSGIDAALLPHVFDLFTQADRTPDRSQGGLGIGLALVKSIVRMHNGQVAAYSDGPQQGTTMTVTLPLADAEVGQVIRSGEGSAETRPLTVTIVDDNADAGQSLAVLLRAHGHTVHVHEDAVSTLAAADGATQVFILDIGLPDMTGYELARRLRAKSPHANAVFVALTGYGQQRDRELSQQAGFDYHLVKPVEIGKLTQILAGAGER